MLGLLSALADHHMTRLGILILVGALVIGTSGCTELPSKGRGIRTWHDLDAIRHNLRGSYLLLNNLDSTTAGYPELASETANGGRGWQPIGDWDSQFTGSFDGQGYEIAHLFVDRPDGWNVGLFGYVGKRGVVKDVGLANAIVTGDSCVGCLVGYNEGSVRESFSSGNISGGVSAEGLSQLDYEDAVSRNVSSLSLPRGVAIGGLVGHNEGAVSSSYTSATVTGVYSVGGLAGFNDGKVSESYSRGSVTGWEEVGGLVGYNYHGTVRNSYSNGRVNGGWPVGGLLGVNYGTVSNSHSTGSVTGRSYVGGLIGNNRGTVTSAYFAGIVTSDDRHIGGLVGLNQGGSVNNSHYNHDEVLINGQNIVTIGALFSEDFHQWLDNGRLLDVNERLSREDGYYMINNIGDFKELLAFGQDGALRFRLKDDLDLAADPNLYIPYLGGEFDGNGHKIENVSFQFGFVSQVGLFGYLASGGKVSEVGVQNVNIAGDYDVGGLVGANWGIVEYCYSTGSVSGESRVGGLLGGNSGTVGNSHSAVSVTGRSMVGGLAGANWGTLGESYSTGSLTGDSTVGGLVGFSQGDVSNSYATASVTGNRYVGGLIGRSFGSLSDCYSASSVTGDTCVGGLVGLDYGAVTGSFWDVETSGIPSTDGRTGRTTAEMMDFDTFHKAGWSIVRVADADARNPSYTWNVVGGQTYPFLSWEPVS